MIFQSVIVSWYTDLSPLPAHQSHIPTHAYIHTYIYIAIVITILSYIINHPCLHCNLTSLPAQQSNIPTCILSSLVTPSLHNTLHTHKDTDTKDKHIFFIYCWDFKKRIISLATDAMLIYPFTIVGKIFIFSNTKESLLWCNQK